MRFWFYGSNDSGITRYPEFTSQSNKESYALLAELGIRADLLLHRENE